MVPVCPTEAPLLLLSLRVVEKTRQSVWEGVSVRGSVTASNTPEEQQSEGPVEITDKGRPVRLMSEGSTAFCIRKGVSLFGKQRALASI